MPPCPVIVTRRHLVEQLADALPLRSRARSAACTRKRKTLSQCGSGRSDSGGEFGHVGRDDACSVTRCPRNGTRRSRYCQSQFDIDARHACPRAGSERDASWSSSTMCDRAPQLSTAHGVLPPLGRAGRGPVSTQARGRRVLRWCLTDAASGATLRTRRRSYAGPRPSDSTVRRLDGLVRFVRAPRRWLFGSEGTSGQTCPLVLSCMFALPSLCCPGSRDSPPTRVESLLTCVDALRVGD